MSRKVPSFTMPLYSSHNVLLAFEETRELTRVVRSTQATLDAIDELMKSLGKFGGASAGRASTIATSTAKSAFLGTKVQLLTVRKPK
jgi:hypothetical protein